MKRAIFLLLPLSALTAQEAPWSHRPPVMPPQAERGIDGFIEARLRG